jgi:hypothetical protein
MAQTSWPFENIDTSETQYSLLFRNVGEGVISGKQLLLDTIADGSGMTVSTKTGDALVRGHYYTSTSNVTLTIAAAHATLPRIDRVVLKLDPTANSTTLVVLEGVPDASPAPLALTQTDGDIYEFPLALVAVGAGVTVISDANLTDQRVILASTATLQVDLTALEADVATNTADIGDNASAIANPLASFITDATTARTITAAADSGKTIQFTSGSATVVTVNASTDLLAGARVDIIADGAGELTVTADGATIKAAEISTTSGSFTIGTQYSAATLLCVATDEYRLIGNVAVV